MATKTSTRGWCRHFTSPRRQIFPIHFRCPYSSASWSRKGIWVKTPDVTETEELVELFSPDPTCVHSQVLRAIRDSFRAEFLFVKGFPRLEDAKHSSSFTDAEPAPPRSLGSLVVHEFSTPRSQATIDERRSSREAKNEKSKYERK